MRSRTTTLLALVMVVSIAAPAWAGDVVDPAFGDGGLILTDLEVDDQGWAVLVDDSGRIVVGGEANSYGVLFRYLPDGTPDASFGTDGVATIPRGIADVALDAMGRIVAVGSTGTAAFVARIGESGALDPTFGVAGIASITFGQAGASGHGVAIQDDGKIVIAGRAGAAPRLFAVARLLPTGDLDTSFSDDGYVSENLAELGSHAVSVAIDATGNIVAAGVSGGPPVPEILRYDSSGNLDPTFALDEQVATSVGYAFWLADVDIQADGKITMSGWAQGIKYDSNSWSLVRLAADGSLDPEFGSSGIVRMGGSAGRHHIAPDGRILLAVTSGYFDYENPASTVHGAIVQLAADGTYQGAASLPAGTFLDHYLDVATLADGGAIGLGHVISHSTGTDFLVVKAVGFNMPPTMADVSFDVADTLPVGSTIGTIAASDDGLGNDLSFRVTGGDVNVLGVDAPTGDVVLLGPLASSVADSHRVTIEVSDGFATALATVDVNVLQAQRFTDVAETSLFFSEIDWIAERQISYGCDAGGTVFCPDRNVTRGQMAAFLVRAIGLPPTAEDFFDDDEGSIFEDDINRLADAKITVGCGDRSFCPANSISRGQMAAFLVRAFDLPATDTDFFNDDDLSIFENDINRLRNAGVTYGCTEETFCPDRSLTRGEMAALLQRALSVIE